VTWAPHAGTIAKKNPLPYDGHLQSFALESCVRARAFDPEAFAESDVREAEKQEHTQYDASNSRGTRVVHHLSTPDGPSRSTLRASQSSKENTCLQMSWLINQAERVGGRLLD
jgi:hypothetical protein